MVKKQFFADISAGYPLSSARYGHQGTSSPGYFPWFTKRIYAREGNYPDPVFVSSAHRCDIIAGKFYINKYPVLPDS